MTNCPHCGKQKAQEEALREINYWVDVLKHLHPSNITSLNNEKNRKWLIQRDLLMFDIYGPGSHKKLSDKWEKEYPGLYKELKGVWIFEKEGSNFKEQYLFIEDTPENRNALEKSGHTSFKEYDHDLAMFWFKNAR